MATQQEIDYVKEDSKKLDSGKFNWEDIATGGYSGINSALFGIPDVLVKAASSDAYKRLKDLRERNKAASLIGDITGAFAPTGGLLVKGLGTGAKLGAKGLQAANLARSAGLVGKIGKAADTAADIIRGTKKVSGISGGVGRGLLAGAEEIVPRTLSGDVDLGQAALGLGIGGAVGGAGHIVGKTFQGLPEKVEDMKKWADKTILQRANMTDKVMRKQKAFMGNDISKYYADLADLAEAKELHRGPKLDEMISEIKDTWKKIGTTFDNANVKIADSMDVIKADQRVANVISRMGEKGEEALDKLVKKVDATKGLGDKREYLNKIIFGNNTDDELKNLALVTKGVLEEAAEELSGLNVGEAKKAWRLMKPFEDADKLEDMRIAAGGLKMGSDTAFKLALAGLGAGGAGATQIKGVMDDPTDPKAWMQLIGVTLGGSLSGMALEKIGISAAKMIRTMPTEKIAEILDDVANGKIASVLAKLPKEELPVGASKFFTGRLASEAANIKDKEQEEEQGVDVAQGTVEGVPVEPVSIKPQVNEVYMNKLNDKMIAYWAQNFSDQMEYSDYVKAVSEATNGFDPKNTVNFMFSDKNERAKFLKDLDVASRFKDVDVEDIMSKPGIAQAVLEPGKAAEKKLKKTEFLEAIARLVTGSGSLPSKSTLDTIQADINSILDLNATGDEKKELILNKLQEKYGLRYDTLKELGLA